MMRNTRLLEVMMKELKSEIDEEMVWNRASHERDVTDALSVVKALRSSMDMYSIR
jgi:hypothetical protein